MSIRCGDSRKGVGIAMDNESSRLLRKECAEILESMKVYFFHFIYSVKSQKINYILLNKYVYFSNLARLHNYMKKLNILTKLLLHI